MQTQLAKGALLLRFGKQFGIREAERLSQTVRSSAPLSQLTLDFIDVRDFEESACRLLADTLIANGALKVFLRGLTLYHAEVLRRTMVTLRSLDGSTL
jgi:hypothetical protein